MTLTLKDRSLVARIAGNIVAGLVQDASYQESGSLDSHSLAVDAVHVALDIVDEVDERLVDENRRWPK